MIKIQHICGLLLCIKPLFETPGSFADFRFEFSYEKVFVFISYLLGDLFNRVFVLHQKMLCVFHSDPL